MHSRAWLGVAVFALLALSVKGGDSNGGFDHRAHSVPGGPYEKPDDDADGFAFVTLNGELSHSHYFNPKTGATGKIVSFKWTVNGKPVCRKMVCAVRFPLGKTVVKLNVVDNTGDSATSKTTVSVYKGTRPGVRMWYYIGNGWIGDNVNPKSLPQYSVTPRNVNLPGKGAFPQFVLSKKFSVRVMGTLNFFKRGRYKFRLDCGGAVCTMWVGKRKIITGTNKLLQSKAIGYSRQSRRFEIVYRRQKPGGPPPRLRLIWQVPDSQGWNIIPGKLFSHTPTSYYPVVHSVSPRQAKVGSVITISGSSLLNVKAVRIGSQYCAGPVSKNQFTVTCTVPGGNGNKKLLVVTSAGTSNSVKFEIIGGGFRGLLLSGSVTSGAGKGPVGYYQQISFSEGYLKKDGNTWTGNQMTAITLGPDGKYYIGSLNGIVHVLTTDFGSNIIDYCKSPKVGKSRSILGVAFNPAETGILRLYASTSVLYWGVKLLMPYSKGWHNGEIISMQKTKDACLARVGTVISGLPVSNHDHAVNGISFDHSGNMLISVGGSTNAGVSKPGDPLGGVPDSPLSGAVLQAPVLKSGFKGKIAYSQYENPATANKVRGDVYVFASGLRNSMCNMVHSSGHIYATDNGANAKFGARSTGCNKAGGVASEPDTLKKLKQNAYFGYANRNRGRKDGRQCKHIPPQSNTSGFKTHIATFEPSTNGIIEYTANTFGAQMRGDILATKFAVSGSGMVYRVQLNSRGNVKSSFELKQFSGITAAMSPTGGLLMPRVYQGKVAVLLPNEKNPGIMVVTSANPFRGPKKGGNTITVTGWNLKPPLTVSVGGKPCTNVKDFKKGRSFTCVVPPGSGKAPIIVKRGGKTSKSYGYEYMYMNV